MLQRTLPVNKNGPEELHKNKKRTKWLREANKNYQVIRVGRWEVHYKGG